MTFDRGAGSRRQEVCDRCGLVFSEGFRWSGLGVPLVLCKECTDDLEESAASYGEDPEATKRRFLERLRSIGLKDQRT